MKHARRILSLILVLAFCLSLTALADDNSTPPGTIIINSAREGATYDVYRIFSLESYDSTLGSYLYKVTSDWEDFIKEYNENHGIQDSTSDSTIDAIVLDNGYVTSVDFTDAAGFAAEAMAYATENKLTPTASKKATTENLNNGTLTIDALELGYYLVDSEAGSLVALDTTRPTMTITEKNDSPSVDKKIVVADDSANPRQESVSASIGDTINFRTHIVVKDGAEKYVLHDKMDAGLTLTAGTIALTVNNVTVDTNNYTVTTGSLTDGCTFEIAFTDSYVKSLAKDTTIRVTYDAVLNENAVVVGTDENKSSNQNTTKLGYGDNLFTAESTAEVKTYRFQLVKTDSSDTVISGAEFKLYDAETGGNQIYVTKESDGVYKVSTEETEVLIEAGKPEIQGLNNGTYYVEEVTAPDGFNIVKGRQSVTISGNANNMAAFTTDGAYDSASGGGVRVINKKGALLPTTGGMGTTLFYVGGVLLIAAAAVLVLKKRKKVTD